MKIFSMAILSSALILCSSAFGQSLEFEKSIVDNYKPGSTSVKAMMIMSDGMKHETSVQLQDNVAVKDLSDGNLIYEKVHSEVFQVTGVRIDPDGKKYVDIKSTNLFIGTKKSENKKMHDNMDM